MIVPLCSEKNDACSHQQASSIKITDNTIIQQSPISLEHFHYYPPTNYFINKRKRKRLKQVKKKINTGKLKSTTMKSQVLLRKKEAVLKED